MLLCLSNTSFLVLDIPALAASSALRQGAIYAEQQHLSVLHLPFDQPKQITWQKRNVPRIHDLDDRDQPGWQECAGGGSWSHTTQHHCFA